MSKLLKIYKASAGSGKTFTLAVEYIKLLIQNQYEYKNILAVTFTNKATAEMKERILGQLYGIAHKLGSSEDYFKAICESEEIKQLGISDEEIRRRAGFALSNIVHDYSRFRIETIDSFFQSVIRELAHELDLTANLKIDLNDKEVLAEAVDSIIDELNVKSDIFKWIIEYIQEKIEGDKNWKIDSELEEFGKNIFNEQFLERGKELRKQLADKDFLRTYRSDLYELKRRAETDLKSHGESFIKFCETHGLTADMFSYKDKGVYSFFVKLSNGTIPEVGKRVSDCLDEAKKWSKDTTVQDMATATFIPMLRESIDSIAKNQPTITTVELITRHITQMRLLSVIDEKVRTLNQNANRFLLADTAHFLRDLIGDSDAPFIYEKIGAQFNHIMIDEFQDTSTLQWQNFQPLISNSLATGSLCLIVGDVKQSIYRWRNSDWSILNNINEGPFGPQVNSIDLEYNRRSYGNIINFNNSFFALAVDNLNKTYCEEHGVISTDLEQAYSKVEQKILNSKKDRGYVRIEGLNAKNSSDDGEDYEERTLASLVETVEQLTEKGVNVNDITILIRFNKYIPRISQYFVEHMPQVRIVSDEAFRLDSSSAVNMIVSALKCLSDPSDLFAKASLAYLYQTESDSSTVSVSDVFQQTDGGIDAFLPDEFTSRIDKLTVMPLYELAEELFGIFSLERLTNQDAYLFTFFDELTAYLQDNPSDIDNFINYWDETLCTKTIPGNAVYGIRIMSIHKSKGLEFHTVLVPFCDWPLNGKPNSLMWCQPTQSPYDRLPLVAVDYNQKALNSIFADDFNNELLRNWVDNVNLLYVAFTRAENNLFIWCEDGSRQSGISDLLLKSVPEFMEKYEDSETPLFTYGEIVPSAPPKVETSGDNVLTAVPSPAEIKFTHFANKAEFRQSNKSEQFISGETDAEHQTYIDEGLLFHKLFSMLTSADDAERVVAMLDGEGCFSSVSHRNDVLRLLRKSLSDPRASAWFDPKWKTFNECTIISRDADGKVVERRPDRVITDGSETIVIDYKTGKQDERHEKQVREYMSLIQRMGYNNVKGYVWYIRRGDIIPVNL